jgi:hypothetical protein
MRAQTRNAVLFVLCLCKGKVIVMLWRVGKQVVFANEGYCRPAEGSSEELMCHPANEIPSFQNNNTEEARGYEKQLARLGNSPGFRNILTTLTSKIGKDTNASHLTYQPLEGRRNSRQDSKCLVSATFIATTLNLTPLIRYFQEHLLQHSPHFGQWLLRLRQLHSIQLQA